MFFLNFLYFTDSKIHCCVQLPSPVRLFATPQTTARLASLSLTISWSLPKFTCIALVMPSNHLILWCPLLLLSPHLSQEQGLFQWVRCTHQMTKILEFQFSISPSNEYLGLIPLKVDGLISLLSRGLSGVFSSTTVQRHQFFVILPSLRSSSHNRTWPLGRP